MMRSRDFMFMDVYSVAGQRIGRVEDILLDCNRGVIEGFKIIKGKVFNKTLYISKKDTICISSKIIVKEIYFLNNFIEFKKIRGRETVDIHGLLLGMLEEIIFDEMNFKIKGLIISKGLIGNLISGKRVILQGNYILGEKNLMCLSNDEKFNFVRMFHNITMEVDNDENDI
ncbi:PRC-barrel domain-containing protein [Clostridium hydrogenum]|uniref:PRC-barrel domain-containing protein n=1 Tax=Clostridium hydrogenum TaxID=2855764 RepID=UPI001F2B964E|nr:PRC-barrel domain-containing protein [Clostridium hydrogenum]